MDKPPDYFPASKTTTIKDIARVLDVSVAAVSHTLSGAGKGTTRVSPEKAALIRETALRMNYRRSMGAVELRTQAVRRVGVVVEKFLAGYPMMVKMNALIGLQEYLLHHGLAIDILQEDVSLERRDEVPEYIRTKNHAALAFYSRSTAADALLIRRCEEHRIPWVLMDGASGQSGTVALDEHRAGHIAAGHLLELGHRRIAYVGYDLERVIHVVEGRLVEPELGGGEVGPAESPSGLSPPRAGTALKPSSIHDAEILRLKRMISGPASNGLKTTQKSDLTRYRGFEDAMRSSGLPVLAFSWVPNSPEVPVWRNRAVDLETPALRARFVEFVERNRPTALVCHNDAFAWTVIQLLRQTGRDVPHDVSVVGMNNLAATNFSSPELTTVTLHYSDLGLHAGQLLLSRLENGPHPGETRLIPPGLHRRESTRRID